jgi:hypothetical protein
MTVILKQITVSVLATRGLKSVPVNEEEAKIVEL